MVINLSDCQFWISRYTRTNQHDHPSSVARGEQQQGLIFVIPLGHRYTLGIYIYGDGFVCVCVCVQGIFDQRCSIHESTGTVILSVQTFGEGRKTRSQKDNMGMIGWLPRRITSSTTPIFAELQSFDSFSFLFLVLLRQARYSRAHSLLGGFSENLLSRMFTLHESRLFFRGKRIDETKLKRNNLHTCSCVDSFFSSLDSNFFWQERLFHVCRDVDAFYNLLFSPVEQVFHSLWYTLKQESTVGFSHIYF